MSIGLFLLALACVIPACWSLTSTSCNCNNDDVITNYNFTDLDGKTIKFNEASYANRIILAVNVASF